MAAGKRIIFIYEYATAQGSSAALPESIRVEGRAMFDSLVADFARVPGVDVRTVVGVDPATEKQIFQKVAATADWSLIVAPEFDGILQQRTAWVEEIGRPLLSATTAGMEVAVDKWATYLCLSRIGVPTPATALASAIDEYADWPPPWIYKPRYGAGSQDVSLIGDASLAKARDDFIVQKYVRGIAASASFIGGWKSILPLLSGYQLLSNDGRFRYQGGRLPLPTNRAGRGMNLTARAIEAIGAAGFVGVDFVLGDAEDGSRDFVIEINPRVTTSYIGLRALAGKNLAEVWLRLADGERITSVDWRPGELLFTPNGQARMGSLGACR